MTPQTAALQAPLSTGFSRQEYQSGLPFPSPGGSSWPRDWTWVTHIADRLFSAWAIREDLPIPGDHHYPLCFHEFVLLDSTCKSRITGKQHPGAGKDWGQEEQRVTDNVMFGWHQWLGGHEFEKTPGDAEGQGGLACCSPWGHKESDTTYPLNNKQQVRDICFLQYLLSCVCLISLSMVSSGSINVVIYSWIYFFFKARYNSLVCVSISVICLCYLISHLLSLLLSIYLGTYLCYYLHYLSICLSVYLPIHPSIYLSFYPSLSLSHICFIHSSIHRHVGCSCILAVLNKTTTNIVMQLPFEVLISSLTPSSPLVIRRSVLLDHTVQHLHADLGY